MPRATCSPQHGLVPVVIGAMGPGRNLSPRRATRSWPPRTTSCTASAWPTRVGAPRRRGSVLRAARASPGAWIDERASGCREPSCAPASRPSSTTRRSAAASGSPIEPLNRYETSLINTVEQALEALGPLLGPGLGLALDSYHLNIEEKHIGDAIRAAGEHHRARAGLRQRPGRGRRRPHRLAGVPRRARRRRLRRPARPRELHRRERHDRRRRLGVAPARGVPGRRSRERIISPTCTALQDERERR